MNEKLEQQFEELLIELNEFRAINASLQDLETTANGSVEASQRLLEAFAVSLERFEDTVRELLDSHRATSEKLVVLTGKQMEEANQYSSYLQQFQEQIQKVRQDMETSLETSRHLLDQLLSGNKDALQAFSEAMLTGTKAEIQRNFEFVKAPVDLMHNELQRAFTYYAQRFDELTAGQEGLVGIQQSVEEKARELDRRLERVQAWQGYILTALIVFAVLVIGLLGVSIFLKG